MKKTNTKFSLERGLAKTFFKLSQAVMFVALIAIFQPQQLNAQCALGCQDVQLSLDMNCNAEVTVAMVADVSQCPGGVFEVMVLENDVPIPTSPFVDGSYAGTTLVVMVTDIVSGNSCWSNLTVEDKLPPLIVCVNDTVMCTDPIVITGPTAIDNCDPNPSVIFVGEEETPLCDPLYLKQLIRKYVAVDASGNVSDTCRDTLLLQRIDFTTLDFPDSLTLALGNNLLCDGDWDLNNDGVPDTDITGVPTLNGIPIYPAPYDACNITVTFQDQTLATLGCVSKVLRVWTVSEWHCQGEVQFLHTQLIEILDQTGPALACPLDFTVSTDGLACNSMVNLPSISYLDNCSDPVTVTTEYPGGFHSGNGGIPVNLPVGVNEIIYTAYDACLNATSCSVFITVNDNNPPIPVCETHSIVSLTFGGQARVYASTFDDGSYDECGLDKIEVRRMDPLVCDPTDTIPTYRDYVDFCCADVGNTVLVVLRVTDLSGNYNECMVQVEVQDKLPSQFTCPTDITVSCEFDFDSNDLSVFGTLVNDQSLREQIYIDDPGNPNTTGSVSVGIDGLAQGNCSVAWEESSNVNVNSCGIGYIERIFTATDGSVDFSGNAVTCSQIITIIDYTPLSTTTIQWPDDVDLTGCGSGTDPLSTGIPIVFNDDECSLIAMSNEDLVFNFVDGACFKILRTWQIIDWCKFDPAGPMDSTNGYFSDVQIIKVIDGEGPEITSDCDSLIVQSFDVDCGGAPVTLIAEGTDLCTDDNELYWTYTLDAFNDGSIDGGGANIGNSINASATYPIGTHRMTFTVEDGCGNKTTCSRIFQVTSGTAPTPYCYNGLSSNLPGFDTDGDNVIDSAGTLVIWASDFDAGSYHVCDPNMPLIFSFSADTADTNMEFTCADVGVNPPTTVEVWVTDPSGNQEYCTTYIVITDNNSLCPPAPIGLEISGNVRTEMSENVEEVSMHLMGSSSNPYNTNAAGMYYFPGMPIGGNYELSPEKDINYLNGVTTLDLVRIQKHLLGIEFLDSPYKMIAADANSSESVSAIDIIELRKLILQIQTELPHNDSWRFVDADYIFSNPNDPFSIPFPETYQISGLEGDMNIDFIGIKIGDVNNSVDPTSLVALEDRGLDNEVQFVMTDKAFKNGDLVSMQVSAKDIEKLVGMQMTMQLDTEVLEFVDIKSNSIEISKDFLGKVSEAGLVSLSWNDVINPFLENEDELFTMVFNARANGNLSDAVEFNSELIQAEVYDNDLNRYAIATLWSETGVKDADTEFALYQNEPNPFNTQTNIGFNLPKTSMTTLSIYDVNGKLIHTQRGEFEKGFNTITVKLEEISAGGLLYYTLQSEDYTATRKMLMLK